METWGWRLETGDWRLETGDQSLLETGDWRLIELFTSSNNKGLQHFGRFNKLRRRDAETVTLVYSPHYSSLQVFTVNTYLYYTVMFQVRLKQA